MAMGENLGMRITLHAVHADDYGTFREAVQPTLRGTRLHDRPRTRPPRPG